MAWTTSREQSIFQDLLEIEPESERQAFLNRACGDNPRLRIAVEALLAAHDRLRPIADGPAVPPADRERAALLLERPGSVIGNYKLMEQIGEGGFGIVFLAEQTVPVRRKVALKIIKPGMDTLQVVARFENERQALALMDHPNIARVLDCGTTVTGRPFFVMELIRGVPITEYCDRHRLPLPQRLRLLIDVFRAVSHAHQKGIVHRDIKPTNVLVTLIDGAPVVKVIDFGVAKAMGQQLTENTVHTGFRQMIGSPLYMSPEQAEMCGQDIDTRADIYALGVLLYELLTGTTPFTQDRLTAAGFDEIRRIIRDEDPPTPSTRINTLGESIATVSINRGTDPRRLGLFLRGDLDWIVMKCLDKDRTRRYETANGLCREIERFLQNEPIEARPPTTLYRLHKFAARNKASLSTMALVLAAAVMGTAVSVWQAMRAASARDAELQARVELSAARQWAAEERAAATARDLEQLNIANRLIESARLHAQLAEWAKAAHELSWAKAEQDFNEAVKLRPSNSHVWSARGEFYLRLGLWDRAAADLHQAFQLQEPVAASSWYFQALLRVYVNDTPGYRQLCRPMETRFAGLSDPLTCEELARVSVLVSDPIVDRVRLVQLAQGAVDGGRTAGRLTILGTAYYRSGQYDMALERLNEASALDANWEKTWHASILAMVHFRLGQIELARQTLEVAAKARGQRIQAMFQNQPGYLPTYWWNIVHSELHFREARQLIDGSLPAEDPRLLVIRGNALAALGHDREATAVFTQAIELDPALVPAWFYRAQALARLGEWEKALADQDQARKLTPRNPSAWNELAWVLATCPEARFRDPPRAVALAEEAVALRPEEGNYWNTLGVARYRAEDWRGALTALTKALELRRGGEVGDWLFLAMVHWRLDHTDVARRWFAMAQARIERSSTPNDELRRFRAEAAALLGISTRSEAPVVYDGAALYTLVLESDPNAGWVYAQRGAARAALKQWVPAGEDFAQAIERRPDDVQLWYSRAAAQIAAGDLASYEQVRTGMLERFGATTNPRVASHVLYICVVAPPSLDQRDTFIRLGQLASSAAPGSRRIQGAAQIRAGQYDQALQSFGAAAKDFSPRAWDWLFLTIAYHHLGQVEQARQSLQKAVDWIEQSNRQEAAGTGKPWIGWQEPVEVRQLRQEVEDLLLQGQKP